MKKEYNGEEKNERRRGTRVCIINNYGSKAYLQNYEVTAQQLHTERERRGNGKMKKHASKEIPRSFDKNLFLCFAKRQQHKEALKNIRSKKWEEFKMGIRHEKMCLQFFFQCFET
jgi:hypothetical protein